jgi:hypothetical protein
MHLGHFGARAGGVEVGPRTASLKHGTLPLAGPVRRSDSERTQEALPWADGEGRRYGEFPRSSTSGGIRPRPLRDVPPRRRRAGLPVELANCKNGDDDEGQHHADLGDRERRLRLRRGQSGSCETSEAIGAGLKPTWSGAVIVVIGLSTRRRALRCAGRWRRSRWRSG